MQEPVFVLHLFTCHGRIMPRLAELLCFVVFFFFVFFFVVFLSFCSSFRTLFSPLLYFI